MKRSTKHLLSFLIASTFVTASAGAVAVTVNNLSDNKHHGHGKRGNQRNRFGRNV